MSTLTKTLQSIAGAIDTPLHIIVAADSAIKRIAQLEAEAKAKELTYTKEKPTTQGWYWFRGTACGLDYDNTIVFYDAAGSEPTFAFRRTWMNACHLTGEFAGPIPQPKEPSQSLEDGR
jgi:hypothetical protein